MTDASLTSEPEKLLPCPFCGGEAEVVCLRSGEDAVHSWARCLSCSAATDPIEDAYSDLPGARTIWNTRLSSPVSGTDQETKLREHAASADDAMGAICEAATLEAAQAIATTFLEGSHD